MTQKLSDYIGIAAAIYVIATFRRRVVQWGAQSMASVNRILKEVWSSEALEKQLAAPSIWDDLVTHQRLHNELATAAIEFRHRPRARSLPGGWGERYRWRKARKRRRRQERVRRVWRAISLEPPRSRDF